MSWFSSLVEKIPVVGHAANTVAHNIVDPLARGAVSAIPGGSAALSVGDAIGRMIPTPGGEASEATSTGASGGIPQSIAALLGGAGKFLTGNNGLNALGLAQGANAAYLGQKSTNFANKASDAVNQSYAERAPMRAGGIAAVGNALAASPFASGKPQGSYGPTPVRPMLQPSASPAPGSPAPMAVGLGGLPQRAVQ